MEDMRRQAAVAVVREAAPCRISRKIGWIGTALLMLSSLAKGALSAKG